MRSACGGALPCLAAAAVRTIDDPLAAISARPARSAGAAANRDDSTWTDRSAERAAGAGPAPTAHELARYEALFAARTRGMKSSAMREMMALTERPDVISLAGGLPDTTTFAPELYAKLMAQVAAELDGARAAVRPDRRDGRARSSASSR